MLSLAFLLLLHAAYSSYEHLSHFKSLGKLSPVLNLPSDVLVECALALLLSILSASLNTPKLKQISWSSEMKNRSVDEMDSRTGFASYNNKARVLFASS